MGLRQYRGPSGGKAEVEPGKVLQALDKEDYAAAFILNPTKAGEIMAVAGAGEKMPQKSTYFYPKLLTGLVMAELLPQR